MFKEIKVSIIVPVYNTEKYLKKTIESLINQTYSNIEIILINDGSTDNSIKICSDYISKDNRIKLINQINQGVSVARNNGMKVATGSYIMFVDSDDYLDLNCIEILVETLKKENVDLIKFKMDYIYGKFKIGEQKFSTKTGKIEKKSYNENVYPNLISTFDFSCVTNIIVASELLKKNGLLFDSNIKYGEDFLLMFQILKNSKSIYIMEHVFYHYVMHSDSTVYKIDEEKIYKKIDDEIYVVNYISNDIGFYNDAQNRIKNKYLEIINVLFVYAKNYNEFLRIIDDIEKKYKLNNIVCISKIEYYFEKIKRKIKKNIKEIIV